MTTNPEAGMRPPAYPLTVGQEIDLHGHRWTVKGIHLGALGQESLIHLEGLSHKPGWTGPWEFHPMLFVPEIMLSAALAAAPVAPAGSDGEAWTDQDVLDLIGDAISDSMDMDWTSSVGAKAVFAALDNEGLLALAARAQPPGGEVVNSAHAAYGALWCMVTDNPAIHAARNHLLAAIGGRGSDAQREAIKWAGRHVQPPSDAEIMAIDAHPAEPAARDGGEVRKALLAAIFEGFEHGQCEAFFEPAWADVIADRFFAALAAGGEK